MSSEFDDARREALARIDALERELRALVDGLRGGAARLEAGLTEVRASVEAIREPEPASAPEAQAPEAAVPAHAPGADVEGARFVALELVLRGVPRAEAERELAAGFPGVDAGALLDDAGATSPA